MRTKNVLSDQSTCRIQIVAAERGAQRIERLGRRVDAARRAGCRTSFLFCDFDEGGPWAGIRDLFRLLATDLLPTHRELLQRHSYELVHVVPTLRYQLEVRNECLTDLSEGSERVRNFPADRAFRIVHGLIDLLDAIGPPDDAAWLMACEAFDHISHLGRRFFRELVRRRGQRLRLFLLAGVDPENAAEAGSEFAAVARVEESRWQCRPGEASDVDQGEAVRRAEAFEERARDPLAKQELLPDLIGAWRKAGDPRRMFGWQIVALGTYPRLGFYEDALRYSQAVRAVIDRYAPSNVEVQWMTFFKTYVSLVALNRPEEALQLVEEMGLRWLGAVNPVYRAQTLYLISMLHVRFLAQRDLDRGEELLEHARAEIEQIVDPEEQVFNYAFNRNGLALVRHFQGRREEAIALCRESYEHLAARLTADRHLLHRSVLIYNIAQVYAALGASEEAVAHFTSVIAMDPHYSEYYNERASLLLGMGRQQEAYTDYRTAIELSPPYSEVYTNLGQCCRSLHRFEEAVEAFSTALDLKEDVSLAYIGRAQAHDELGQADEALADYDAALRLLPDSPDLLANRAVLLFGKGMPQDALLDLNRAIELAPEMPELYENRAFLLGELGRAHDAAEDLRRLLRLVPSGRHAEVKARLSSLEARSLPDDGQAASSLGPLVRSPVAGR